MKQKSRLIPCECACGKTGPRGAMKIVRMTDGPARRVGSSLFRTVRSYRVLPGCVRDFKAELQAKERCRLTLLMLAEKPRWRRLLRLPSLFALRRAYLRRRLGDAEAKRQAWAYVRMAFCVPKQSAAS